MTHFPAVAALLSTIVWIGLGPFAGTAAAATPMPPAQAAPAPAAPTAPVPALSAPLLPAYAHNDYRNAHPLFDALEAGYQGVEADVFLVDGRLLVGHERDEVSPERTLEALYLAPLRRRLQERGELLPGGRAFLLNVELKSGSASVPDPECSAAYDSLRALLGRYRDLLTVVRDGVEIPGSVHVILVGRQPSLEQLMRERERYVSVQWLLTPARPMPPPVPAHLIRLVSLNGGMSLLWSRGGGRSSSFARVLQRLRRARGSVPGRIARIYNVPARSTLYRGLLANGVDLIGTKDLRATRELLLASP